MYRWPVNSIQVFLSFSGRLGYLFELNLYVHCTGGCQRGQLQDDLGAGQSRNFLVCQLNFTAVDDYTYILYSGYFWGQCMHEGGGISKKVSQIMSVAMVGWDR